MKREIHRHFVENLTATFHENTLLTPETLHLPGATLYFPSPPPRKDEGTFVPFPPLSETATLPMNIQEAIVRRRSVRAYRDEPMSLSHLGQFLAYSTRVTAFFDNGYLPPVEPYLHLYLLLWGCDGVPSGTYRYDADHHGLIFLSDRPTREEARAAIFQQEFVTGTGILLLAADLSTLLEVHGQRGYRYLLMYAGMIGETAYLVGTALGIGVCANGGLRERVAHEHAHLDGLHRDVIWSLAFGLMPLSQMEAEA